MKGAGLDSAQYLLTISLISSVVVATGASIAQRFTKLGGHFLSNCIVAAAATIPFAFLTASRGAGADLLKEHGVWLISAALTLLVAGLVTAAQQMQSRNGAAISELAERFIVNWLLSGVALVAYLVVWVAAWMAAVVGALAGCC